MYRSQERLDHAFVLAGTLFSASFAASGANAHEMTSTARPQLDPTMVVICQATTTTVPDADSTTETNASDEDFFSWIQKLVGPGTDADDRTGTSTPLGRNLDKDRGGRGGGGHGGGGGGNKSH